MKTPRAPVIRLAGMLLLVQGLLPALALAQGMADIASGQDETGSPFRLESSTLSVDGRTSRAMARGDVRLTYGGMVLTGDEVFLDAQRQESFAKGHVRLLHGRDILTCDSLSFKWVDQTGVVENGDLLFEDTGYHVRAGLMEKTGPDTYSLEQSAFTTCLCPSESSRIPWQIDAADADIALGGYAKVRKAKFRVLGVPVLYFPVAYLPVKVSRESGFLIPGLNQSQVNGWGFAIPYFWAINASLDLTATLEAYTKRGVKPDLEFRYRPSKLTEGTVYGSGLYDLEDDDLRYGLKARHSQELSKSFYDKADVNLVSDQTYIEDFPADVGNTADWFLLSRGGFGYRNKDFHATAGATYTKMVAGWGGKEIAQQAPEFSAHLFSVPVYGPWLSFSLDSTATNYVNEYGQERVRGQVYPEALMSIGLLPGLNLSGRGGVREVLSWGAMDMYDVPGAGSPGLPTDRILNRTLAETGAGLNAIFGRPFRTEKYRLFHIVEPSLEYQWIREVQGDPFPVEMDGLDTLASRNWFTYRLRTSLWAAEPGGAGPHILGAEMELAQSLALQRDLRNSPTGSLFSDVHMGFRVSPLPYLTFLGDLQVDPYSPSLRVLETGVLVSEPRGYGSVQLGFLRHDGYLVDPITLVELVDVYNENYLFPGIGNTIRTMVTARPVWWLSATWQAIFLVDEAGKLENLVSLKYLSQCKCWSIVLRVHQTVRPDDVGFSVSLQMEGLGSSYGGDQSG